MTTRRDRRPPTVVSPAVIISAKRRPLASATWRSTKAGLRVVMDMAKSNWVYRKLRNFRAGIESDISCLKRGYGLARCIWRGLDHFRACIWSSVVAYNLLLLPGSSQADRSIPSPMKLSLDRPELGSNPHGSPRRQRRLIAVYEPTPKKSPALSCDVHPPLFSKIKQSFMHMD